ncbi:hypothetical protein CLU96_1815 [Chryseobacterium sp. 52]|uniref:hypothetical protein n=1 Tax=Chryseobacterium sp. 52 TaxID=2035213 RepID=UPI000C18C3F9|nr:hypothetical protein [Chryseobacterium sp. 52]PIF44820.1 hypothetical protein CLU96_1815 [Chryseobacterium sp. 52]
MDNYYNTSHRMYKSSKTLHSNQEYHNSCYLAGYVVECYAKIIIGLSYGLNSTDLKEFGHDLKKMRKEFQYIFSHSSFSSYMLDIPTDFSKISLGTTKWNPMNRYSDITNEWIEVNSNDYQNEMLFAMQKITQMKLDGHNLI